MRVAWVVAVVLLSASGSASAAAPTIEVSADEPELATAAAKSLLVQFPGADVQPTSLPEDDVVHVIIRRLEPRRILVLVSRGRSSTSRLLEMENPTSALDLGESVALAVPEMLASFSSPKSAPAPVSRRASPPIVPQPGPEVTAPTVTQPVAEPVAEPVPEPKPPPADAAAPPPTATLAPAPESRLVLRVAVGALLGPRVLSGLEAGVAFSSGGRFSLGLSVGAYLDAPAGQAAGALIPLGVRAGVSLANGDWEVLSGLGPELVLLVRGGEADMLPALGARLGLAHALTPRLALGLNVSALVSPGAVQVLDSAGKPLVLAPVLVGLSLELRVTNRP